MAFVKITQLPQTSSITADDLFVLVDDPAGNPTTKKIAVGDLLPFFQGQVGPPGPTGPQGAGIVVLGVVANPSFLPLSGGNVGDAYIDASTGDLYIWNGSSWQNAGPSGAPGVGVPTGGAAGEVLAKIDGTDYNTQWVPPTDPTKIPLSIVDAKGDLIVATANDTVARLAVGSNGHVLTADTSTASGLTWAAIPPSKIVNYAYSSNTSSSLGTTPFSAVSIAYTPLNASNLLVIEATGLGYSDTDTLVASSIRRVEFLIRNTTTPATLAEAIMSYSLSSSSAVAGTLLTTSPQVRAIVSAGSTSARTYDLYVQSTANLIYGVLGFVPNIISVTEVQP